MNLLEELKFKPGVNIVVNEGRWSAHDLLTYLLSLYPDASVLLSSYAIGEHAIRVFDDERISDLRIILDKTMLRHKVALLEFATNTKAEVKICDNHSKVLVLNSKMGNVAFVGSQNYTKNRRVEIGILFVDCKEVEEIKEKLEGVYINAYPL